MGDAILVLNAGSSSLKFSVHEVGGKGALEAIFHGQVEGAGAEQLGPLLRAPPAGARLVAVGHRVVHGGLRYDRPVRIDPGVVAELERLVPLAPLHQPHPLAAIRAVAELAPELPQVACFDTAFHRAQPLLAQSFALPRALAEEGVRRYGFHGLSYEYIASALPRIAPELAGARVVVAHLGNGASLCAMRAGRSVATTMGLTALDGLVMGTRPGALDPGVVLYLMRQHGMEADAVERLLYEESGLLGVSGVSSDMRELLASDDPGAREAIDLFVYRVGRELGSMAAALGGVDALVFTGGIGENAAAIRDRVCRDAAWLGVRLDAAANEQGGPRISERDAPVSAWVVPTDENRMIAAHTLALLRDAPASF